MGKKQCVYPATNRWGWHMHSCREPCPNCNQGNHVIRGNNNIVYNQVALKKRDGTNGYHPVDTRCTLVGIETKWFDRAPQATIKIDGKTYVVKSTDLSIHTVKGEADRRANLKGRVRGVYNVMRAARHLQRAGRGQAQGGIPGPSSRRNSNAPNVNVSKRSGSPRSPSRNSNMVEDDDSFGLPSDFRFDEYVAEPLSPRSARSNRSSRDAPGQSSRPSNGTRVSV